MNINYTQISLLILFNVLHLKTPVKCENSCSTQILSGGTFKTPDQSTEKGQSNDTICSDSTKCKDKIIDTLDIKNDNDSSNNFEYIKNGKIITYKAKDNHRFNKIKDNQTTIWSTDKPDQYSVKVVLDGRGKKKKTVTIHLGNGGKIVFHKPEKNKPWNKTEEISGLKDLDTKEHPSNVKLFTADSTDSSKTKELENTQYKVKQDPNKTDIYVYELNDGSKCTLVKCDDKDVWRYDSTKNEGIYPKSLVYNKTTPTLTVNIGGFRLECNKDADNWKCEELKLEGVIVNLHYDKKACSTFDYKDESDTTTYTAKSGYGIKFVKELNETIYFTNDMNKFASKVEYTSSGSGKSVTIYLPGGQTKTFKRGSDGKWKEDASEGGLNGTKETS